jgi:non-ribosomal peptide synthetase component E (peptide arylation enzyme)
MAILSRLISTSAKESLDPSWLEFTFSDLWEKNAKWLSDKEAVVDSDKRLTWLEANHWINQIAYGFLQLGYKKDDRIVIQLPNCVELPLLRIACERAGLVCVHISRVLRGKEVEYILIKVEAKMLVTLWKFRDFDYFKMVEEMRDRLAIDHIVMVGEEVPPGTIALNSFLQEKKDELTYKREFQNSRCTPEEFSLVTHTTGTTGFPKFVENPIFSRMELAKAQVERIRMDASDVIGILSPTAGGPNTIGYFASPLVGAKAVMIEHFEPKETLKRIEKEKITVLPVVPTMLLKMIDHPKFKDYDLGSLRVIVSAGDVFNYHDALRAEEAMGCPIIQFYGSADSGLGTMGDSTDPKEIRLKTVGKPLGRWELKLLREDGKIAQPGEEGEVLVRSRDSYSGFFRDPEANRVSWDEDGWYRMGDLGKLDQEGNLIILGRKKNIIIRGGQNIVPSEIEGIISQYEKVANVAVIGMPDKIMGEKVCAYVIPKKGLQITMEEINSFLKENRIAHYKLIERLEIVDEFPILGGKINKKILLKAIHQKIEREKLIS